MSTWTGASPRCNLDGRRQGGQPDSDLPSPREGPANHSCDFSESRLGEKEDDMFLWLAWRLPRPLVYWAAIRLLTYKGRSPGEGDEMSALRAWGDPQ